MTVIVSVLKHLFVLSYYERFCRFLFCFFFLFLSFTWIVLINGLHWVVGKDPDTLPHLVYKEDKW